MFSFKHLNFNWEKKYIIAIIVFHIYLYNYEENTKKKLLRNIIDMQFYNCFNSQLKHVSKHESLFEKLILFIILLLICINHIN